MKDWKDDWDGLTYIGKPTCKKSLQVARIAELEAALAARDAEIERLRFLLKLARGTLIECSLRDRIDAALDKEKA